MIVLRARTLLFIAVSVHFGAAIETFQPPTDTVVFLDKPAVFRCEVIGGLATWRVNGTVYNSLSPEIRDDLNIAQENGAEGNEILNLTIPGRAEYNGTRVQCVTLEVGSVPIESQNVTMTVQGVLSSVVDLRTSSSATSVIISWTAPFSLDVTGVDPDIWYSVLIYNVTDEPTAVPCTDCINITETHYTFTPDYPSPCHKYIFTVIPLNGAGQGETSHNVTGYTIENFYPIITVALPVITAVNSYFYRVTFLVSGDVDSVCTYSLTGLDQSSISDILLLDEGTDEGAVPSIANVLILSANSYYTTSFEISNAATGTRTITPDVSFTTFDVQIFTAKTNGSEIVMTGVFAANSSAKGLFVVLQSDDKSPDQFRAVLRDGQEETVSGSVSVPPSTYTVLVYDLEENALPNQNVAIPATKTLTVKVNTENEDLIKPATTFQFLKGANISLTGSEVHITCEFSEAYPESSCVLIYREYGNTTLIAEEYNHNDEFPVTIPIDIKAESSYTFAIFGKNGNAGIDLKPVNVLRYVATRTTENPNGPSPSILLSKCSSSSSLFGEGVGVGIAIGVTISSIVAVAVIIIMKYSQKRGQRKVTLTRNAAYEVRSPSREMGGDQREVPLTRNVAYEVHSSRTSSRNAQTGRPVYEEVSN